MADYVACLETFTSHSTPLVSSALQDPHGPAARQLAVSVQLGRAAQRSSLPALRLRPVQALHAEVMSAGAFVCLNHPELAHQLSFHSEQRAEQHGLLQRSSLNNLLVRQAQAASSWAGSWLTARTCGAGQDRGVPDAEGESGQSVQVGATSATALGHLS